MRLTYDQVVAGLTQRGVPLHVAQGVAMNFKDESGLNPGVNEQNPASGRGGFGLAQWTGDRRDNLENYAASQGVPASDPNVQMDFFMRENGGPEASAWSHVMNTNTPQEAAAAFVNHWERPREDYKQARIAKYMGASTPGAPTAGAVNPAAQQGFAPANQPLPQEAKAFANAAPVPAAPNPAGFLSGLGSLLVSSANAAEPTPPSLNAPAHAPDVNTADPLGVEAQGNGLLDWEGSYPDVPPQDPYSTDLRTNMRETVGGAASAIANDRPTSRSASINDMLSAMGKLGSKAADNLPKLHINDILGAGDRLAAKLPGMPPYAETTLPPDRPMPTGLTPGWSGIPSLPGAGTSPQDIPAPVQGPPMSARLGPMQGPPMSAMTGPVQGPPMSAAPPRSPDYGDMISRHPPAAQAAQDPNYGDMISRHPPAAGPADPVLPDTAPVPTKKPTKTPFDTIGFLTALSGMAGLLGTGGPEVKPVSLSAPMHQPNFQGLPMPRGLL
jgi:hypothetical protein